MKHVRKTNLNIAYNLFIIYGIINVTFSPYKIYCMSVYKDNIIILWVILTQNICIKYKDENICTNNT